MTILAGIDEAGFGPVLGPLVVSASLFDVPDERLDVPMWETLAGTVCRKPSRRKGLIAFGDSKKLYGGLRSERSLQHLERGVLTMLWAAGSPVGTLRELLENVCPAAVPAAADCPWYAPLDLELPHDLDRLSLQLDANSLAARLAEVGIKPLAMRSEVVLEGEFNRLIAATDNKSSTLFDVASRLFAFVWSRIPQGGRACVFVDHQGGRMRYLEGLQRVFEGCRFKVRDETEQRSAYTIHDEHRAMEIEFLVKAEDRHLPVALASMLCKYLRELLMTLLNRYWATQVADLPPTAGYYTDGNRFYQQIRPMVQKLGFDENRLYRCR